jgi:pyruvate dehydrogenase E2 component (dihydrolipoamide acetyltransferase)
MAFSVQMPALGESVTEGTVTRWLKQEGDTVALDEPLVEVSTDKVDTEIPSPAAGVLQRIVAAEDETVEVGGELAVIGDGPDDWAGGDTDGSDTDGSDTDGSDTDGSDTDGSDTDGSDTDGSDTDGSDTDGGEQADTTPAEPAAAQAESQPAPVAPQDDPAPTPAPAAEGTSVTMPALGESVTEGTVTRWLKAVGDEVAVDEPLLEVSTDKVDTEIPSPVAGTVLEISAAEDETVQVGGQLAVIGAAGTTPAPAPQPEQTQPATGDSDGSRAGGSPADEDPESGHSARTPLESEVRDDAAARAQAAEAEEGSTPAPTAPTAAPDTAPAPTQDRTGETGSAAPYVTPLVRKLATDKGVDLAGLTGTGVGGRIRKQDVEAAADAAEAAKAEAAKPSPATAAPAAPAAAAASPVCPELAALRGTTQKASRIRQITATKTRESLQNSAQLTQTFEVDMSRVAALRSAAKAPFAEREGVNLTFLPFFAKAVVEALKTHPNVNASYDEAGKEITYHGAEHLSIAVDTPAGLLSPVIHNAGDLSLAGLARAIADLAARSRTNRLKPDELSGGTFTITNIGSQGALFDTPILVPPQAAMLGTGAIVKRPVVVTDSLGGDTIAIRSMCFLPLTYDHRLVDGADAGRFLTTIKQRLEQAAFEADLGL